MDVLTPVAIKSLVFAAAQSVAAVVLTYMLVSGKKKVSFVDKLAILWFLYDAIVHFTLEFAFLCLSLTGTVVDSEGFFADVWKEYAKADSRWGVSDPTIVALELVTVPFNGALCLIVIYAILKDKPYRHYLQIVLQVCELYGGWMTFCPEWVSGSKNLDTSNPLYLWLYLVFFNGLWVVAPILLLWQSWVAMVPLASKKQKGQ